MRRIQQSIICATLLALLVPVPAFAVSLREAAIRAAKYNDAKVLSAKTVQKNNRRWHEIKLLTKKGVVKTVTAPANGDKTRR